MVTSSMSCISFDCLPGFEEAFVPYLSLAMSEIYTAGVFMSRWLNDLVSAIEA